MNSATRKTLIANERSRRINTSSTFRSTSTKVWVTVALETRFLLRVLFRRARRNPWKMDLVLLLLFSPSISPVFLFLFVEDDLSTVAFIPFVLQATRNNWTSKRMAKLYRCGSYARFSSRRKNHLRTRSVAVGNRASLSAANKRANTRRIQPRGRW